MKILRSGSQRFLISNLTISEHSSRLIYPKFKLESVKMKSFTFDSSKVLNYFLSQDILY
jgi:hypothetical protein